MFLKFRICWLSQSIPWSSISGHSTKSLKFGFVGTQLCTVELNVRTITNTLWVLKKFSYISLCECSHCPVNGDLYEFTESLKFGSVDFHRMSRKYVSVGIHMFSSVWICAHSQSVSKFWFLGIQKRPCNLDLWAFKKLAVFRTLASHKDSINLGLWIIAECPV